MRLFWALSVLSAAALALNNGLGLTPPMGYSSWNDCTSAVNETHIKAITLGLISTGLAQKGYIHVNVDEGWMLGRNTTTGEIISDPVKFPSGMKALGDFIHSQKVPGTNQTMLYGLYTSRGTCQCSTSLYHAVGSFGYYKQDGDWMVAAGMDYLKMDSCCGTQVPAQAFAEYGQMRDVLAASGRPVYFSLCGWYSWYAPVGTTLGNQWRIAGDGQNWGALCNCINTNVGLWMYAGPGGWNDPDLLIGTGVGSYGPNRGEFYQTDLQSRAQFTMWCVMSAPLIISANINAVSAYAMETWGNEEAIAVDQTFRKGGPYQGQRLWGGNLYYNDFTNPVQSTGANVWGKLLPGEDFALVFLNNWLNATDVTCDPACFAQLNITATSLAVRDLWAHADMGVIHAPFNLTAKALPPSGGVAMYRFTPATAHTAHGKHDSRKKL